MLESALTALQALVQPQQLILLLIGVQSVGPKMALAVLSGGPGRAHGREDAPARGVQLLVAGAGAGEVVANGRRIAVTEPGCHPLVEHPHHTAGVLELAIGDGVTCHATCFTPGIPAPGARGRPAGG